MSDIREEIGFVDSGLNWDDDPRFMFKGDSSYRLNILVGEDGANGVITNMQGNTVVSYPYFAEGCDTHFVLGSLYDELNRCVYYWVFSRPYDTTGSGDYEYDNRLLRFNEDTETIDTIFVDTSNYFGLHPNYPMKDPFIIGDWLYFNPRVSEPKMIDVERAYNFTNFDAYDSTLTYLLGDKVTYFGGLFLAAANVGVGETPVTNQEKWDRGGDSYQDFTAFNEDSEFRYAFNVIKQYPVYRPVCNYASDADYNANNLRGMMGRFAYRYKYFDNTHSRYSAYSDVTLPINDESYKGEIPDDVTVGNCIDIVLHASSPALVKEIEVAYCISGGNWKRVKILNRMDIDLIDQPWYTYRFYNNETYPDISNSEVALPYDSVPRTAECQEIINKNILCYAHCKEGFDNLNKSDLQVTLQAILQDIDIPEGWNTVIRDNLANTDYRIVEEGSEYEWLFIFYISNWNPVGVLNVGDIFIIQINEINFQYTIQAGDIAGTNLNFAFSLAAILSAAYPLLTFTAGVDAATGYDRIQITGIPSIGRLLFYRPSGAPEVALTKYRDFKSGAHHPFCLFYYDGALRRWDAQVSRANTPTGAPYTVDGTTIYIPALNEHAPLPATTAYKWVIDWEVNHVPPDGSKYWRWGYAGNSLCSWFVQYTVEEISASVPGDGEPLNTIKLNIRPLQTIASANTEDVTWNEFRQTNISPYEWQRGDRVRFITEKKTLGSMGAVIDGLYDYEILGWEPTDNYLFVTDEFDFAVIVGATGEDALIEIYRPKKADTEVEYYEFGPLYPILEDENGILLHGGQTQNQDIILSQPATGRFNAGDIYRILRTPSKPINLITGFFHESLWYSDFYDSDDYDRGKIGFETTFGERYLNIVRYSNQYLQNTEINGLSTFEGLNLKELNDIYGKILRIIAIGDTLKVYQRKKPSSILVGRTEYYDADGNANIQVTSDRVLGAIRYSQTNYGTEFPESISRNNRYVYGFDVYNGVFWRDSANGIFPISGRYENAEGGGNYKMDSYFKQKAKALLVSGIDHVSVMTVWDERYKLLYVIFKDIITEDNDEVIVFHEPSNRWICFTEFDQTPSEGWNQMIELTYSVVRGFEAGIDFYFDEDTRFAVFNIQTPPGFNKSMTVASLTFGAPDPTVTVSQSVSMATPPGITYGAPDPTTHVTLAPAPTIYGILNIPPGRVGLSMEAMVYYDNVGDAVVADADWRIRNSGGDTVSSGTESVSFEGYIDTIAQFMLTLTYPSPAGTYTLQVKLSSTPTWTGAATKTFNST